MPLALAEQDLDRYRREGAVHPLRALSESDAAAGLARVEAIEASMAGRLSPTANLKIHLLAPWLWDLVQDPRVVDPVSDILGSDILCWGSSFFAKAPGAAAHVPWHQDATYWGLSSPEALTAWIAFTPSVAENGCLRIVPGTHLRQFEHGDSGDPENMLPGREEVRVEVNEADGRDVVLRPGEMSLHHVLLIHGSRPNRSGIRRVGFAIRYIAGHLGQSGALRGSATLVRGRDHGRYDLETRPESDFHPEAVARHRRALRQSMRVVVAAARQPSAA